ncbi:CPBP family glutamic-type intramembrane protease [Planctomicrobium sp. SH664]|uniref:CPBP family glutamic-type intramembrane protease n=1 Tax=Planctomicrobium sp. SH664 TaxID=3448125 RepID=UPI003F5C0B72
MSSSAPPTTASPPLADYWVAARQPWTSLLFVLPFLAVYELGVLFPILPGEPRNGADLWIRQALQNIGCSSDWLFPLLVPVILLSWQVWKRLSWKCSYETLAGMLAESLLFALLLVGMGRCLHSVMPAQVASAAASPSVLSYLGAGIYEELLFRLMLLPLLYAVIRFIGLPGKLSAVTAIIISSLLFAAAHYVETTSLLSPTELMAALSSIVERSAEWSGFAFRCAAGIVFATLFWVRGFGIAVGAHLCYDLIVGLLLNGLRAVEPSAG